MKTYAVRVRRELLETYVVEASSEDDARLMWAAGNLVLTEWTPSEVSSVEVQT